MAKNTHLPALDKKSSRFFRFYTMLCWILILACVFGWIYLYKTLNSYEASLPATYADAIVKEIEDHNYSSLVGLSEYDLDALKSHISVYGIRFAEKKELSREKGDYTYRVSSQGMPLFSFTLAPDGAGWKTVSASVEKAVVDEYTNTISIRQAELVADCISSGDYSALYSVFEPTGYVEDSVESLEAFMKDKKPARGSISFAVKDSDGKRVYDIVTENSLFARVTLSEVSESQWQIDSFALSDSLKNAYALFLADQNAAHILTMLQNAESESLYPICIANGYPEADLNRFDALIRSVPAIGSATCSLFENSDASSRSYLISTEDKRIASFTLATRPAGNMNMWAVSSFELPIWKPFEGTVTAPACFTVTVDGKTLGANDEISRSVPKNIDRVLTEKASDMVTEVTYRVKSAFPPETMQATRADGVAGVYTAISDREFRFDLPTADDRYKDELNDFLVEFSQAWGRFSMNDTPYAEMVKYVEQLSTAYIYIYGGDYAWIKDHYEDKTSFANFKAENFIEYAEDIISCDISYDMTVVYVAGDTVETYSPAYRIFLRKTQGQWKVFSFNTIAQ